ncbi:CdaR family transcriptional regulator [Selenihalanaerobacter shriftii]|uniref:Carbohydrate diacid regulator n=1 Tax=Selenihalanaerobacter shriftii TaxID=142842 RepID=A0A1T4K2P1_9FIRM|nr:sugar diacid recognition domain-containing protein [Selenihalanaerobacter shriftii]SJZ36678.1 carbohydrate diacid regulator [Selenihalanaerobacter shriftii]
MEIIETNSEINLTSHLAQTIVNRTMQILERNINIMDETGMIIGSGNAERVNTLHEGAREVILEGKELKISKQEAERLKGVKPGINLPIHFNGKIIGVVGITGIPKEVEKHGGLVKMTAELMLQQAFYLQRLQLEEQAEEYFIKELLNGDLDLKNALIYDRAEALGYNIKQHLFVSILEVINLWDELLTNSNNRGEAELHQYIKRIRESIEKFFSRQTATKVFHLTGKKFIIISYENEEVRVLEDILKAKKRLVDRLKNRFKVDCRIGIGRVREGLLGIKKSFEEGLEAINLGKKFYSSKEVYHIEDLKLERMTKQLPVQVRKNFADILPLDHQFRQSLEVYFSNNLNISETARNLYLHRNSIIYRLERIKEITGLDPKSFDDAVCLKLTLLCHMFETEDKSEFN